VPRESARPAPRSIRAGLFSLRQVLSLPPARARLFTITQDRTGLTGRYAMELDYLFPATGPSALTAPPECGAPSLSTAVREQ